MTEKRKNVTLLQHLLSFGYDPKSYLDLLDEIETAENDKAYLQQHPEEAEAEELRFLDNDIKTWESQLNAMREDWYPLMEPDMELEIQLIRDYVEDSGKVVLKVTHDDLVIITQALCSYRADLQKDLVLFAGCKFDSLVTARQCGIAKVSCLLDLVQEVCE